MSFIDAARSAFAPGGRNGLASSERRDPIGLMVAALNKLAQAEVVDRLGIRRSTEQTVFRVTSAGFRTVGATSRAFTRSGEKGAGTRVPHADPAGVFDLTPSEDQQMLVDVVSEFAAEVVRPAAADANEACLAPDDLLEAGLEIGLPILGVPEELGGVSEERSEMTGTLVHEALCPRRPGAGRGRSRAGRRRHCDRPLGQRRAAGDLPAALHREHRRPGSGRGARTDRADPVVRPPQAARRLPFARVTATCSRV